MMGNMLKRFLCYVTMLNRTFKLSSISMSVVSYFTAIVGCWVKTCMTAVEVYSSDVVL